MVIDSESDNEDEDSQYEESYSDLEDDDQDYESDEGENTIECDECKKFRLCP